MFIERAPYYGTAGASRIVLYSDSIVVLQIFSSEYRGIVRGRASALTYDFGNPRLPWIAFGSRRGDTLSIDYDAIMGAVGFESGKYIFAPGR